MFCFVKCCEKDDQNNFNESAYKSSDYFLRESIFFSTEGPPIATDELEKQPTNAADCEDVFQYISTMNEKSRTYSSKSHLDQSEIYTLPKHLPSLKDLYCEALNETTTIRQLFRMLKDVCCYLNNGAQLMQATINSNDIHFLDIQLWKYYLIISIDASIVPEFPLKEALSFYVTYLTKNRQTQSVLVIKYPQRKLGLIMESDEKARLVAAGLRLLKEKAIENEKKTKGEDYALPCNDMTIDNYMDCSLEIYYEMLESGRGKKDVRKKCTTYIDNSSSVSSTNATSGYDQSEGVQECVSGVPISNQLEDILIHLDDSILENTEIRQLASKMHKK